MEALDWAMSCLRHKPLYKHDYGAVYHTVTISRTMCMLGFLDPLGDMHTQIDR